MTASLIEKVIAGYLFKRYGDKSGSAMQGVIEAKEIIALVRAHEAEHSMFAESYADLANGRQPKASAELVKLIAECRDALQAGMPYMVVSTFTGLYVRRQIRDQISRCEAGLASLQAAPVAQWSLLTVPTKRMCDGARGFIMGLDLNCRTWSAMEKHLDAGGYDCLPYIRQKAKEAPKGHITKWDVADCIWQLMQRYHPVPSPAMGDASLRKDEEVSAPADASPTSPASDWIGWHGGACPVLPDTLVEVVYRDSPEVIEGPIRAKAASELWSGQNDGDDIIRYRIVREGEQP